MTEEVLNNSGDMSIVSHLDELRNRLKKAVYGFLAALMVTLAYSEQCYDFLALPLFNALPASNKFMAFSGVVEPFVTYLKVSLTFAILLASPVIFYQFWLFVAPGLKREEKKWLLPIVIVSVGLFIGGASFAYYIVFPLAFEYLLGYANEKIQPYLSMSVYFGLVTKMLIAFGIIFLEPLVVLILARLSIVSVSSLLAFSKYLIVIAVVLGAAITPPDVVSQLLLALPIIVLYYVGVFLAYIFTAKENPATDDMSEQ